MNQRETLVSLRHYSMASSLSETCSADEDSEPESTELDRPLVREKEWHEHVAMALINLSEKVHSLLHRYERLIPTMKMIKTVEQNETIPMELMKIAVIINPIHLFTHLANEWMPPYTEIKYLHPTSKSQVQDRRKSCLRIELLLTHLKRGIDHLPFILFSTAPVNNASAVLKRYRSFVTRSLVEIRTQLINGDEKASDEDLAEYFLGLGRLLTEVRKIHHINKQSEDYRLKLNAMVS